MPIDERALYREIGARIRKRRGEMPMTQEELAEAAGLLRTSIANIESGRQRPPLHVLYNLSAALGIDLQAILPSPTELSPPQLVALQVHGSVREVTPKTAELLQSLLEE